MTFNNFDFEQMPTLELEMFIESRYEAGAAQAELDFWETIFSTRVTEENPQMGEEDPSMSEEIGPDGGNLNATLIQIYHQYQRGEGPYCVDTPDEFIALMRKMCDEEFGYQHGGFKKETTDQQILEAAKDLYDWKKSLLNRLKTAKSPYYSPSLLAVISTTTLCHKPEPVRGCRTRCS